MKKNLIALAVLAASGVASAQSSVTLYGIADVWLGTAKVSGNVGAINGSLKQNKIDSGGVSSSRWGLKGSEDLGGGLKANFVLEQGFAVDTGVAAASGFNREANVGLAGGFGEVKLGKTYTPYDDIRGTAENTFDANISASRLAWVGYNVNPSNSIKYISPNISGFSGAASYSLGENKNLITATNNASSVASLNVQYANGPVFVGYAHQTEKGAEFTAIPGILGGAGMVVPGVTVGALQVAVGGPDTKTTHNLITGSYDFGVVKLQGSYNQAKYSETNNNLKANEYQLGVQAPLASNLLLGAGYAESKLKDDGGNSVKTKGFSAALVYVLSQRTVAYAAMNQSKFTTPAILDVTLKAQVYGLGVKHAF